MKRKAAQTSGGRRVAPNLVQAFRKLLRLPGQQIRVVVDAIRGVASHDLALRVNAIGVSAHRSGNIDRRDLPLAHEIAALIAHCGEASSDRVALRVGSARTFAALAREWSATRS